MYSTVKTARKALQGGKFVKYGIVFLFVKKILRDIIAGVTDGTND